MQVCVSACRRSTHYCIYASAYGCMHLYTYVIVGLIDVFEFSIKKNTVKNTIQYIKSTFFLELSFFVRDATVRKLAASYIVYIRLLVSVCCDFHEMFE